MGKFKYITIAILLIGCVLFAHNDPTTKSFKVNRGKVWSKTIKMANERYATGWGIGTYKLIFPAVAGYIPGQGNAEKWWYGNTQGMNKVFRRCHNCYLQILFETGYMGLGLFLGFLIYLIRLYNKSLKNENQTVMMSGAIMVMVSMLMYFPSRMVQTVPLLMCLAAYHEKVMEE